MDHDLWGALAMALVAVGLTCWGFLVEFVLRPAPIRVWRPEETEETETVVGVDLRL